MRIKTPLWYCFLLLCSANAAYGKEWRGIVPLHSTRMDVEKLLGPPKVPKQEDLVDYETEAEQVTVMYASGPPCDRNGFAEWKVPRGTVIGIIVHPRRELRLADLHLDESTYKKTDNEGHGPPFFYYANEKEGIKYEVIQGLVRSVAYFPTAEDDYLRCSVTPKPPCPKSSDLI